MQVYFLLKIVLHCFFCLINWDPKVHRIDASHSHKSQRGEHFLIQIIQFLFMAFCVVVDVDVDSDLDVFADFDIDVNYVDGKVSVVDCLNEKSPMMGRLHVHM